MPVGEGPAVRQVIARRVSVHVDRARVVAHPLAFDGVLRNAIGAGRKIEAIGVAIETAGHVRIADRGEPLRVRPVGQPERVRIGDLGGPGRHAGRRATQHELRVKRALRHESVRIDAAVIRGDLLQRAAATVIEEVRQLGAEAGGVDADVGVGHVKIEAVRAADETVGDAHREPAVAGEIRILLRRNRVPGRLAVEMNGSVIIHRPLAEDRCAVRARHVEAEAEVIDTWLAIRGWAGTDPLRVRAVGDPRRCRDGRRVQNLRRAGAAAWRSGDKEVVRVGREGREQPVAGAGVPEIGRELAGLAAAGRRDDGEDHHALRGVGSAVGDGDGDGMRAGINNRPGRGRLLAGERPAVIRGASREQQAEIRDGVGTGRDRQGDCRIVAQAIAVEHGGRGVHHGYDLAARSDRPTIVPGRPCPRDHHGA